MQKQMITLGVIFILFITACSGGSTEENVHNEEELQSNGEAPEVEQEEQSDQDTQGSEEELNNADTDEQQVMRDQFNQFSFIEFSLEADYEGDKEFEAEIEQNKDGTIEASVEDDLQNEYLLGKEAFDYIVNRLSNLSITSETPPQDVLNEVVERFELDPTYLELEIEIEFADGKEIEVKDKR